jgi:ubiquinol-cytochrome c reductase cytochrome b subunit
MRNILIQHIVDYPTPLNLNWSWNWGALSGIAHVWQLVTGIFLAMHFGVDGVVGLQATASARSVVGFGPASDSGSGVVGNLQQRGMAGVMRDITNGSWLRASHANGASFFFLVVYVHMVRGFYYSSWKSPNELVWLLGLVILILMILTAFIGYVLPWGQMSFWGATVITSLASAVPILGWTLSSKWLVVHWLWGGFAVDAPTVGRFFSLHYTLPFLIAGAVIVHIVALHRLGSTNPLGLHTAAANKPFHPYFTQEDMTAASGFLIVAAVIISFYPDWLGHADNFIPSNPYSTPAHIVPEWYFLWVYAVLRSIPNKTAGVALIGALFVTLAALPLTQLESRSQSPVFRPLHMIWFWTFAADLCLLVWLGAGPIEPSTLLLGQLASFYLVGSTALIIPLIGAVEHESMSK